VFFYVLAAVSAILKALTELVPGMYISYMHSIPTVE